MRGEFSAGIALLQLFVPPVSLFALLPVIVNAARKTWYGGG
ncbi:MAG TPA: hypothetical protein VFB81_11035 [Myxococcales bacterium]|nr:hypothetical protein [Myxococcales bacterium]